LFFGTALAEIRFRGWYLPDFRQVPPDEPRRFVVEKRTPQNCRWAEPTLYLPLPYWLEAWNMPWSCRRDDTPRLLLTTTECAACTRWAPRDRDGVVWDLSAQTPLGR
jgi:hypothetical protein